MTIARESRTSRHKTRITESHDVEPTCQRMQPLLCLPSQMTAGGTTPLPAYFRLLVCRERLAMYCECKSHAPRSKDLCAALHAAMQVCLLTLSPLRRGLPTCLAPKKAGFRQSLRISSVAFLAVACLTYSSATDCVFRLAWKYSCSWPYQADQARLGYELLSAPQSLL